MSLDGVAWTEAFDTVAENIESYNATGLQAITVYYWRVRAYNEWGVSNPSGTCQMTTDIGGYNIGFNDGDIKTAADPLNLS